MDIQVRRYEDNSLQISANRLQSMDLLSLMTGSVGRHPREVALICRHQSMSLFDLPKIPSSSKNDVLRWTYNDLLRRARQLAANLYLHGFRKGTNVISFLDDGAEVVLLFWACMLLGCIVYPMSKKRIQDPVLLKATLRTVIQNGVIFTADRKTAEMVERILDDHILHYDFIVTSSGNMKPFRWLTLIDMFNKPIPNSFDLNSIIKGFGANEIAFMVDSHGSNSSSVYGMTASIAMSAIEAFQTTRGLEKFDTASDQFRYVPAVALQNQHFYHPFGMLWALGFWACGGTIVIPAKSFDASEVIAAIEQENCTHMAVVPAMVKALAEQYHERKREVRNGFGNVEIPLIIELNGTLITQQPIFDSCLEDLTADSVNIFTPDDDFSLDQFGITAAGRVDIIDKYYLKCLFLRSKYKRGRLEEDLTPMEAMVRKVWASVLGMNPQDLPVDRDILDFADSLAVLQASAIIARELELTLTSTAVALYRTIEAQAKSMTIDPVYIDPPPESASTECRATSSPRSSAMPPQGPPHMYFGIPHLYFKLKGLPAKKKQQAFNEGFKKTKGACNEILNKFQLGWADVEDVLPMPPAMAYIHNYKPHANSWVVRNIFTIHEPPLDVATAIMNVISNRHPILRSIAVRIEDEPYYVVVRPRMSWLTKLIFLESDVSTLNDLKRFTLDDLKNSGDNNEDNSSEGPMFRAVICRVKSTGATALVLTTFQGVADSSSLSLFIEDVMTYMTHGLGSLKQLANYKLYACNYFIHKDSENAVENCYYFSRPLMNIRKSSASPTYKPRVSKFKNLRML